jgi:hypothetical protein
MINILHGCLAIISLIVLDIGEDCYRLMPTALGAEDSRVQAFK